MDFREKNHRIDLVEEHMYCWQCQKNVSIKVSLDGYCAFVKTRIEKLGDVFIIEKLFSERKKNWIAR